MKSILFKFVRTQEVLLYVEAKDPKEAKDFATGFAREFLSIDDENEEALKEDLDGGSVRITTGGCNGEVTKYSSAEICDEHE